jgi:O6-methylguanine-DNA--protein-cysteine methyltransferase
VVVDLEVKVAGDRVTEAVTAVATVKVAMVVGTTVMGDTIIMAAVTAVTGAMITADMAVIIPCYHIV